MKVILCLDDRGGMMFNRRRQSRDRALIEDAVASLGGETLCIAPYSQSLFAEQNISLSVSENFLDEAGEGAVCFVEDRALQPYKGQIGELVIYRWNRHYPSDLRCDLDPTREGFRLAESREFVGTSHDCITKEIYRK